jgi:glycosidase
MQWERAPAAGFTAGKSWEALQPDSFTANVAVEDRDTTSLLNLYRRLIHAREASGALRNGILVPLETGSDAVVAYVRRDSSRVALVVANLGSTLVEHISLSSPDSAAPPGRYRCAICRWAVGAKSGRGDDGRITDYLPLPAISPRQAYVFELIR